MNRNYNYQAFTPEEVKKGLLNDLLNYLLDHNKKNNEQYYDIHITSDGYCSIVEWADVDYNSDYGPQGKFEFVDSNQVVMIEKTFPDNHIELCYDEEDYQERLEEFLEKNPGWEKTEYGTWTNRIENEKIRKYLAGEVDEGIPEPPTLKKETTEEAYNKLEESQKKKAQELLKNED